MMHKYKLLSDCQSGFMKFHSCQTALTDLMNHWYSCLDQGSIVGALNVDLRKAFNLINHDILISKLKIYGCSSSATNWFHSCTVVNNMFYSIAKCHLLKYAIMGSPRVQFWAPCCSFYILMTCPFTWTTVYLGCMLMTLLSTSFQIA